MHENIKQAGIFLIKAVVCSLIFWSMWLYAVRPVANAQTDNYSCNNQAYAESTDQDAAMKMYREQLAQADKQLRKNEEQQQRMDSILTKQEQQSKRLDAILSAWESQAKIVK